MELRSTFQDAQNLHHVMPPACYGDLRRLKKSKIREEQTYTQIAAQPMFAILYLYASGHVHRDHKLENVSIYEDRHIKLEDFGFAEGIEGQIDTIVGTSPYRAPEIVWPSGYGKYVDWWAFDVTLFEILYGYRPFSKDDWSDANERNDATGRYIADLEFLPKARAHGNAGSDPRNSFEGRFNPILNTVERRTPSEASKNRCFRAYPKCVFRSDQVSRPRCSKNKNLT